ncbi:hypothetical protein [Paenibacillus herberti]|uniref:Carbonate dehydratase n=1 Tax=Paenibacillus herberti TaxID=1619309 RepID=A0A229P0E2_9BACL|nr:hypothetical protein [Paenibacillus herberti]OXM15481.1 carbonate dehydratase [Paenibacillus herberti]
MKKGTENSRKLNSAGKQPKGPFNTYTRFISKNPRTTLTPIQTYPKINKTAFVGPYSTIVGDVTLSDKVLVADNATVRADSGGPIFIGANSSISSGGILNGEMELTFRGKTYSIYVGQKTVISHGAVVNGATVIGDGVVIGAQSAIYYSIIGDGCFISTGTTVRNVVIAPNRFVPHGATVLTQEEADALGEVPQEFIDRYQVLYTTSQKLRAGYSRLFAKGRRSKLS